jgi:hypothetical protein
MSIATALGPVTKAAKDVPLKRRGGIRPPSRHLRNRQPLDNEVPPVVVGTLERSVKRKKEV